MLPGAIAGEDADHLVKGQPRTEVEFALDKA
jgi:hypothetical protein